MKAGTLVVHRNNSPAGLIQSIQAVNTRDGYHELRLQTRCGAIVIRYYDLREAETAVLMVGGVGGDFDSPAKDLYPRLASVLQEQNTAALRVQFRDPVDLDDSVMDVLAGIEFLRSHDIKKVVLVGYSFGGAVAVQAALSSQAVVAVATLSTQGFGTEGIEDLAPRPILFIHGYADEVLPASCSIDAHARAGSPKRLVLMQGARHGLEECADEVFTCMHDWLSEQLQLN